LTETTTDKPNGIEPRKGEVRPRALGASGGEGSPLIGFVQRFGAVLMLIIVCIVFSILSPDSFATKQNAVTILQQEAVLACLALGLLLPIAVGEFDLSVGYVLGFVAVVAADLGGKTGLPGGVIVPLCILIGLAIGTLNGILTSKFKIHSLIATLGVGFAVSGGTIGVSGGTTLFQGVSPIIPKLANTNILGLKSAVWIVFALAILLFVVLEFTPFGKRIYAVGGSERVARLAGVRTDAIKIAAFAIAGGMAACAGILQLGQAGGATPAFGINLLLPAFAAIFLGATAIKPGVFNVWGTIIAILLLAAGFTGLGLQGVPLWVEPIFDGVVLLVAVMVTRREARSLGGQV
jgi:ribose transport system permease protein